MTRLPKLAVTSERPSRLSTAARPSAIARVLLEEVAPLTQTRIGERAGVTQARVSQVLADLRSDGLVVRSRGGWRAEETLLDRWLDTYPGPGGVRTHWFGLDDLYQQVSRIPGRVSADLAADVLAPWRRPTHVTVYSTANTDLEANGLVATGPDQATLTLVTPADPSILATPSPITDRMLSAPAPWPLAPVTQILWDLRQSPAADRDEAIEALRQRWREAR